MGQYLKSVDERGPVYEYYPDPSPLPPPRETRSWCDETSSVRSPGEKQSIEWRLWDVCAAASSVLLFLLYSWFGYLAYTVGPSNAIVASRALDSTESLKTAAEEPPSDEGGAQPSGTAYSDSAVERYIVRHLEALANQRGARESSAARLNGDILEEYIEVARHDDVDFPRVLEALQSAYFGFRSTPGHERVTDALERRLRRLCSKMNPPAGFDPALAPRDLSFKQGFEIIQLSEVRHAAELSKTLAVLREDFRFEHTAILLQKEYEKHSQGLEE